MAARKKGTEAMPARPQSSGGDGAPPAGRQVRAAGDPRVVNKTANELRWLAEAADGMRDRKCALVWSEGDLKVIEVKPTVRINPEELVLNLETNSEGDGLRRDEEGPQIEIVVNGRNYQLAPDADAVFFTQSAVEKFVFPYYTRMQAPDWIGKKKRELFATGVVAAVHRHPSITTGIGEKNVQALTLRDDGTFTLR
jgi:hypothetical protein